jgi:hypothetical protein
MKDSDWDRLLADGPRATVLNENERRTAGRLSSALGVHPPAWWSTPERTTSARHTQRATSSPISKTGVLAWVCDLRRALEYDGEPDRDG